MYLSFFLLNGCSGPIWIAVTLIVSSAISHGIAQFIQNAPLCVAVDTDMRRTSFVASAVFLYTFLLPSALWAFLKYQGVEQRQPLPSYMCLYGYSMAIFIPVSVSIVYIYLYILGYCKRIRCKLNTFAFRITHR